MQFLEGPVLTFLEKTPLDLPSQFTLLDNIEDLKAAYCSVYSEIAQIKIQIKMMQEQNQKQYHTIIEQQGGIPCNDDFQNFDKNIYLNNQMVESQQNTFKKNSFHHVCYDLRVLDQQLKENLIKISLLKIQTSPNQESQNIMDIEEERNTINQTQQIQKYKEKSQNPIQSTRNLLNFQEDNNIPTQLQPQKEGIENQNKLNPPLIQINKNENIQNINQKILDSEKQKYASFRDKMQHDKKIKVIIGILKQQTLKNNENNNNDIIKYKNDNNYNNNKIRLLNSNQSKESFLSKRKLDVTQFNEQNTKENHNNKNNIINNTQIIQKDTKGKKISLEFSSNNFFEKQPGKRFKSQILDNLSLSQQNEDQQNDKPQSQQDSNHFNQIESAQLNRFQQPFQNDKYESIYQNSNTQQIPKQQNQKEKKDNQGNTSSTASTINRTGVKNQLKIGTAIKINNKNSCKNSSNSSGSSNLQNQDESSYDVKQKNHQQFNHFKQDTFISNSSSDNQNQFIDKQNNDKQNQNQVQDISLNDQIYKNQKNNQIIQEEDPYFGQRKTETKLKLNNKFQKNQDKYHEGYENDEEFDYDEEEDRDRNMNSWGSEQVYLLKNKTPLKQMHFSKKQDKELPEQLNKFNSLSQQRYQTQKNVKFSKTAKDKKVHLKNNSSKTQMKNFHKYLEEIEYLTDDM